MIPIRSRSPVTFLRLMLGSFPEEQPLGDYASWWEAEGMPISDAIDRIGTPWLRMFDQFGRRIDGILYPPEYWKMLKHGYQAGAIWRAFEEQSMLPAYRLGYVTAFHDPGLYCPYTVSLSTAVILEKYGDSALNERFLPQLLRQDEAVWQGATWMTEVRGGSDLGAAVVTVARRTGDRWRLTGEKYFASNVGAELAVVAARPEEASSDVRGLALFLLPRYREDGRLNYLIRRLKDKIGTRSVPTGEVELLDSEAYLLGKAEWGIYLILEALNISRAANSIASVALAHHALCDALDYAENRIAFGKPIIEHPLLRRQFEQRWADLHAAFALAWESVERLNEVWRETPPYSERYHLFRLIAHLAKYWTAELAVQTARWSIEVHGGIGTLAEQRVEHWLREAMILLIWEGTSHRQILDGIEVMERKAAHRLLFQHLSRLAQPHEIDAMNVRIDELLTRPHTERETLAEDLFRDLAVFTATVLSRKLPMEAQAGDKRH